MEPQLGNISNYQTAKIFQTTKKKNAIRDRKENWFPSAILKNVSKK